MANRSILTNTGKTQLDNAIAQGQNVNWNKFGVGDGTTSPYAEMTDLENRKWTGNLIGVYAKSPGQVTFNGIIPTSVSGFTIREVGIFDDSENLVAVAKCNEINLENNNETEIEINFDLVVQDSENITVIVEDSSFHASKEYVDGKIEETISSIDKKLEDITGLDVEELLEEVKNLNEYISELTETVEMYEDRIRDLEDTIDTISIPTDEDIKELFSQILD